MGIGMPEVIVILVIALVVFGPRKLPELGKSFGQAMAQFRRASEDFKRTWEQEVELEQVRKPDSAAAAASTYDYNTSNDPYDPYQSYPNEPEATSADGNQTAADTTANAEVAKAEPAVAEAATGATATKPEKHWI
jgi:sec-independent protein translocase protein TatA